MNKWVYKRMTEQQTERTTITVSDINLNWNTADGIWLRQSKTWELTPETAVTDFPPVGEVGCPPRSWKTREARLTTPFSTRQENRLSTPVLEDEKHWRLLFPPVRKQDCPPQSWKTRETRLTTPFSTRRETRLSTPVLEDERDSTDDSFFHPSGN